MYHTPLGQFSKLECSTTKRVPIESIVAVLAIVVIVAVLAIVATVAIVAIVAIMAIIVPIVPIFANIANSANTERCVSGELLGEMFPTRSLLAPALFELHGDINHGKIIGAWRYQPWENHRCMEISTMGKSSVQGCVIYTVVCEYPTSPGCLPVSYTHLTLPTKA